MQEDYSKKYVNCQSCKAIVPYEIARRVLHGQTDHVNNNGRILTEFKNSFYCKNCFNERKILMPETIEGGKTK